MKESIYSKEGIIQAGQETAIYLRQHLAGEAAVSDTFNTEWMMSELNIQFNL
jgi:hypothetical protein